MASKVYKDIQSKNIDTQEVCPCLVNEQENGILNELNKISKLFQNWIPDPIVNGERRIPRRVARGISHGYPPKKHEKHEYRMIDGEEYEIIPELKDSKTWNTYWKSKLFEPESKEVKEQNMFNFAMYMFCKINYA